MMNEDQNGVDVIADPPKLLHWLLRLLIVVLVLVVSLIPAILFKFVLGQFIEPGNHLVRIIQALLILFCATWGYRWYVRRFEHREMTELSGPGSLKELGLGMALGAGLMTLTIAVLAILGYYHIDGTGFSKGILDIFLISVIAGFLEELTTRGILFRLLEEGVGSWIALAISAIYFGAAHLTNEGATLFSAFAVAVEFGVLLALAYMVTRRLWLVIGFHFAWNFTLGGIFGITVSGVEVEGFFHATLEGPTWATGGGFGPESTFIALLPTLAFSYWFYRLAKEKGRIVPLGGKRIG